MAIFIWMLYYNVVVYCAEAAGCIQSSMANFNYLFGIGALELIFELGGIVKIYAKKKDVDNQKEGNGKKYSNISIITKRKS